MFGIRISKVNEPLKTYIFSIFVRSFLAFSGFLVFVMTAYLYGAEGRGIIGYATSLYAIFGTLFSMNLGRSFLAETLQEEEKKHRLLGSFLTLNLLLGIVASIGGWLFWYFSPTGQQMLTCYQASLFALTSVFYIWTTNGNFFFSSFLKTSIQEVVILCVRLGLILVLGALVLMKNQNIDVFITIYAVVLFLGVFIENIFLLKIAKRHLFEKIHFKALYRILKKTFIHHVDYLAFNIFPLVLTVLCASYITKADVGRVNFAVQIINLIFLFAVTANIRATSYISASGFRTKISQYKKLFIFTFIASIIASAVVYTGIKISSNHFNFHQFEGVENLFAIACLAVPGYIMYQLLNPIWIELKKEKALAGLHFVNFAICIFLTPFCLREYRTIGVMYIFVIFHCGIFLIQFWMLCKSFYNSDKGLKIGTF